MYCSCAGHIIFATQIWHLEHAKEDRLAATLQQWYKDAQQKRLDLQLELEHLEEDQAGFVDADIPEGVTSPRPVLLVSLRSRRCMHHLLKCDSTSLVQQRGPSSLYRESVLNVRTAILCDMHMLQPDFVHTLVALFSATPDQ